MQEFLRLKKSNCKNCYKCIRHCPVKSIKFSGNQAHIVEDECILCGQCFVVCPQNAKEIASQTEKVKTLLAENSRVVASIAPSFIANYDGAGIESMKKALRQLGFFDAEETAIGATMVKNEYMRILREEHRDILISSCCHSVNLLIQKYFPSCLPYLADVQSPMQAHCQDIKKRFPDAKTVFIGPCVSKKDEAERYPGIVDAVLTFEELTEWMQAENVTLEKQPDADEYSRARYFPTSGGILKTMRERLDTYTYMVVDGTENCIAALKDIEQGNVHNCFIEMSACAGSCIGGPVMEKYHRSPIRDYTAVAAYAGEKDFPVAQPAPAQIGKSHEPILHEQQIPSDAEITAILRRMGKNKPEDELNCGSCGYNTCREKAVAIYQGKADLTMCLPFLKDRAESFSDTIIQNTPNGILVLNEDLEVQQINRAALKLINMSRASDVLGEQVVRILEPKIFMDVRKSGVSQCQMAYLAEYDKYVEQTVVFDKESRVLVCILRDVTEQERQRERKESFSRKTIETADQVVDKQMRIVQEIASLLGETAAETKIALTQLKESISDE